MIRSSVDRTRDRLSGGSGDDTLTQGACTADSLFANLGNKALDGGADGDVLLYAAGDGADTIADCNSGNSGALDDGVSTNNDFIDLSALYTNIFELRLEFADDGIINQSNDGVGKADYSDNTDMSGGSPAFPGASASIFSIDNTGLVCFAKGTLSATYMARLGERLVRVSLRRQVVCYHQLLPMHKVLFANGTRAENVYPGAQNMRALKPKDRGDLLRLLPGLQEQPAEECYGGTAYRSQRGRR